MIDLPVALAALDLRWRQSARRGPRFRRIRRAAVAVRCFAGEWRRTSSEEWITHFERPFSQPEHTH